MNIEQLNTVLFSLEKYKEILKYPIKKNKPLIKAINAGLYLVDSQLGIVKNNVSIEEYLDAETQNDLNDKAAILLDNLIKQITQDWVDFNLKIILYHNRSDAKLKNVLSRLKDLTTENKEITINNSLFKSTVDDNKFSVDTIRSTVGNLYKQIKELLETYPGGEANLTVYNEQLESLLNDQEFNIDLINKDINTLIKDNREDKKVLIDISTADNIKLIVNEFYKFNEANKSYNPSLRIEKIIKQIQLGTQDGDTIIKSREIASRLKMFEANKNIIVSRYYALISILVDELERAMLDATK